MDPKLRISKAFSSFVIQISSSMFLCAMFQLCHLLIRYLTGYIFLLLMTCTPKDTITSALVV